MTPDATETPRPGRKAAVPARPEAVLFDRDGTLCRDVPYNDDPRRVVLMPTAAAALRQVRRDGIPTAVVSNQSGIGRGLLTWKAVDAVNARLAALLGDAVTFHVCPHVPTDGCGCRKPAPGLLVTACHTLGVRPQRVVMIGDIGADMAAAAAVGARGVLVPTPATRRAEIAAAPEVAPDLLTALARVFSAPPADVGLLRAGSPAARAVPPVEPTGRRTAVAPSTPLGPA
ncbi:MULTISPECIES: D-glycero-alpha-D-manno-heptose-1,7-bisphosphate 7-phosphatase [Parafrankia]|uniref:D-glycero-alpha-D-manno-heptose-1,7-bisphosphate 7-phosphatase n=1 Tax=Parafrankia TaxID=2994362 RepID=UPI001F61A1DF|nr:MULTISPECIES: HAD family hydrolase [Parafrankia]